MPAVKPPVGPAEVELLIDLGANHWAVPLHVDGVLHGFEEWHRNQQDAWCGGWVPIKSAERADPGFWDLHSEHPLTISPSVLCTVCGNHGFIRDGRWEGA